MATKAKAPVRVKASHLAGEGDRRSVSKNMGVKGHQPTEQSRQQATMMAGLGLPQTMIALLIGCNEETLRKHYASELELGVAQATAAVAKTLYEKATKDRDLGAAIFWMKARAGWREVDKQTLNANVQALNITINV